MFKKFFSWIREHIVREDPINEQPVINDPATTWEQGEQTAYNDSLKTLSGGGSVEVLVANVKNILKFVLAYMAGPLGIVGYYLGVVGSMVTGTEQKKQELSDQKSRIGAEPGVDGLNVFIGAAVVVGFIMLVRKIFSDGKSKFLG